MKENNIGMSRRGFLRNSLILSGGLLASSLVRPEIKLRAASEWERYQPGDQVFGAALGNAKLFSQPSENAGYIEGKILDTYKDTSDVLHSPRYIINEETILPLKMVDADWAEVVKQDGTAPFSYRDSLGQEPETHFVRLKDFEPIHQLEPVSCLPGTTPKDKEIVILHNRPPSQATYPHMLLIEQDQIVAHIPVILGAYSTPTPKGTFYASTARLSNNMPEFPGVGYGLEIEENAGIWIHNGAWWIWPNLAQGRYGSHGCINLPDKSWNNASIDGQDVSMARFIFQWALTNMPEYDQKTMQSVHVDSTDPEYSQLLPVHIQGGMAAIKHPRANDQWDWKNIAAQYSTLREGDWIVPKI